MLTFEQAGDFAELTINNIKRKKWTDLAMEFPEYLTPQIFAKHMTHEKGGPLLEFKVKVRNTGTARATGLYDPDQTGVQDLFITGYVPWRFQTANYSYDVREDLFQTDREMIVSELVAREHAMYSEMIEFHEDQLFYAPASSQDNFPMGIRHWIQADATTTPDGYYNGGNPAGFSGGCAGIDSTVYPRWKNWTFGYNAVTTGDAVRKVKKAISYTKFTAPRPHPELKWGDYNKEIYVTYDTQDALERLAETRNENHGKDVARFMNQVVIAGCPVVHSFWLTQNATDSPMIGINWSKLRPFSKKGQWNVKSKPIVSPRQHQVRDVFLDCAMNYACLDRRSQWIGTKPA